MKQIIFILCLAACFNSFSLAARAESRPKVGLVLGGGGAKGAAEVGILKVIEESGIPVDYVAGTSIGAIVGGLWASGYTAAQLDSMFRSQTWLTLLTDHNKNYQTKLYEEVDGVSYVLGFPIIRKSQGKPARKGQYDWSTFGAIRGDNISTLLDSMTRHRNLRIPFRCVAVDVKTMSEVLLPTADISLPQSMRASMAIPGIFQPIRTGNQLLIDGGMLNNLPVDIVREMGADIVIAVDLTQEKHDPNDFSLKDLTGVGGLVDWVLSRPDRKKYATNRQQADIYINPPLEGYDAASFSQSSIRRLIQLGEQAARRHHTQLQQLAHSLNR